MKKKKILVISAHPDDETLGCGGYILKYNKKFDFYSAFFCNGVSSRKIQNSKINNLIKRRKNAFVKASKMLGIKKFYGFDYPDNQLDKVPLLEIIKKIEELIKIIKPAKIFTHSDLDLNIDHKIISKAVITATRPINKVVVNEVLFFEILSSSEWSFNENKFSPNLYTDISDQIKRKISVFKCYKDELRKFPHPRSIEGIKILSQYRGMESGTKYAESFKIVRSIK